MNSFNVHRCMENTGILLYKLQFWTNIIFQIFLKTIDLIME